MGRALAFVLFLAAAFLCPPVSVRGAEAAGGACAGGVESLIGAPPPPVVLVGEDGKVLDRYLGMEGYLRYAEDRGVGLERAYIVASKELGGREAMEALGWREFHGSVEEFRALRGKILDDEGRVFEQFVGMNGQAAFAEAHYGSDMTRAYLNVSAVLGGKEQMDRLGLGWRQFHGTVVEFLGLRAKILDTEGKPFKRFVGMDGQAAFAEAYCRSSMKKAYLNVSAVLGGEAEMERLGLGWRQFQGTVAEFLAERNRILDDEGVPFEHFVGMNGLAVFAEAYYGSDMTRAYLNVSAVLGGKEEMERLGLGWQQFHGTVVGFLSLRTKILDAEGVPFDHVIGMDGLADLAEAHYGSDMQKAYQSVSAVLGGKEEMEKLGLGWQMFQGKVREFRALRAKILDAEGVPFARFVGMDGLAAFADAHYGSDMKKAYMNVSALLGGKKELKRLGLKWKIFIGGSTGYRALVEFFRRTDLEDLVGLPGQRLVADRIFGGHTFNTYHNVSILREALLGSREAFAELGWRRARF